MAISNSNTIFVYNENDPDSLDIALQYQNIHDLDLSHLIPINCSSTEVLADYSTFQSEVENPIIAAIAGLSDIWVIVLGYNVPGGFYDGVDVIAATSRLTRINQAYSKKIRNPLYDRKVFKSYNYQETATDPLDSDIALICSRIDGPNKAFVEDWLFNSKNAFNTNEVNGRFYLDPYSDRAGTLADLYQLDLTDFETGVLPTLNIEPCVTSFIDPYVDSIHHQLYEDSFYWGWFNDRGSSDFFRSTDTTRFFFYNADFDGAESFRYASPDRWAQLSIANGYTGTAGAMSDPGIEGLLRPDPFFVTLREESNLGEAMLFSSPYLNWSISFFGDPLQKIAFPATYQENLLDEREQGDLPVETQFLNEILLEDTARLISYGIYRDNRFEDIRDQIAFSVDIPLEVDTLVIAHGNVTKSDYYDNFISDVASEVVLYFLEQVIAEVRIEAELDSENMSTMEDYLDYFGISISRLIAPYFEIEDTSYLYDSGYWKVEINIQLESNEFEDFHFEIQIATDEAFSSIIETIDSSLDQDNWFFEESTGSYEPLTSDGIGSNYVGNKIKYDSKSSEYLDSSEIYYFRIRQKSALGTYSYRTFEDIIWT